jgi:1-deoxy-D-xylulose-5-phosphate synthase
MLEDEKVTPITAGMLTGTGLYSLVEKFPNRVIDVGIAEEHAVTYASGLAKGGLKPIVCIYSTFMQRAYDQIMHDVCINNLPVVFCLDRAGLVGADGKTHQGVFDLSYLSHMPNMNILAPKSTAEFEDMLKYAISLKKPCAIRYPNGKACEMEGVSKISDRLWEKLFVGNKVSVLAVGQRMIALAKEIEKELNFPITIINARSVKPLDEEMLLEVNKDLIITLEENSLIGGFGSLVKGFYAEKELDAKVLSFGIKDTFIEHGSVLEQLEENGLTAKNIADKLKQRV